MRTFGPGAEATPGGRYRLDGVHVAQPSPGHLEVGFEQERELTVVLGALGTGSVQFGEADRCLLAPVGERTRSQALGQVRVAGHVPRVEQPERDLQVTLGYPPRLRHGADRMIELRAGIPDRVPDPVRDRGDAVPAVVQQQHVQVAAWQQFPPAVSAHRDESHARLSTEQAG